VIVVGLVVYAILGLVTDALVRLLERRALRWR
jgi:sulfonate transport system permease protein